jgi:hypothetical protein
LVGLSVVKFLVLPINYMHMSTAPHSLRLLARIGQGQNRKSPKTTKLLSKIKIPT